MIKNYLYTIGKNLSPSQRDEVLKEIEANLYDYLEENFGKKEYTDGEIESALRAMGHPKTVAQAYQTSPRSLIGAAYIDSFWLVVKIAIISSAIGITVGNLIDLSPDISGTQLFIKLAAEIFSSGVGAFGMVTLIFALIEHYSPQENTIISDTWKISDLEKVPEANEKVSLLDLIIETFFICIGLVVMNSAIPIFAFSLEETRLLPIVNMDLFAPFIVMITLVLAASLLLNIYLMIFRKWQITTRIITILLDLVGIGIVTKIAMTPEVWDLTALTNIIGRGARVETWFTLSVNIGLAVMIIVTAFDIFGHIKAILKK